MHRALALPSAPCAACGLRDVACAFATRCVHVNERAAAACVAALLRTAAAPCHCAWPAHRHALAPAVRRRLCSALRAVVRVACSPVSQLQMFASLTPARDACTLTRCRPAQQAATCHGAFAAAELQRVSCAGLHQAPAGCAARFSHAILLFYLFFSPSAALSRCHLPTAPVLRTSPGYAVRHAQLLCHVWQLQLQVRCV